MGGRGGLYYTYNIYALCGLIIRCYNASTTHTATLCKSTLKQTGRPSFRFHQVSLSMDKRLSRGGGRRLPDFCLSSTRPMPYFPRSWIFVLYLVALFQKCPRFFWVPCPVICLACVLAGLDWLDSYPSICFYSVMWSRNFPRINCRAFPAHLRLSMPLLPAWPGLNLYDWPPRLIWVLRLDFICFFTLEFIRLLNHPKGFPLSGRKRRHRTIFTEAQLREVGALFHFSYNPKLS